LSAIRYPVVGLSKKKRSEQRLGFAIAHNLYCSPSLVVGPPCLFSLSNAEAFSSFIHFSVAYAPEKRPPSRPEDRFASGD
jgi:hypothetical protein